VRKQIASFSLRATINKTPELGICVCTEKDHVNLAVYYVRSIIFNLTVTEDGKY
jgi:hypothetical protein